MTTTTEPIERRIPLEGAFNVRDLGGYGAANGKTTQWGRLFRADGLHKLTEQDRQELLGRGIRTVVDLRHEHEVREFRNVFADSDAVTYRNISLINPAATTRRDIRCLGDMYVDMLDNAQPVLKEVLDLLAEKDGGALFHCSAGKDRTGVLAGLLLSLAGVSRETIVADYEQTGPNIAPILGELRKGIPDVVPEEMARELLGCAPSNMVMMLDHLESEYGGGAAYMRHIGLGEEQIEALLGKLLG
ncbi:tyrosine-protein phosphatase [Cohnella fermenti]|uniref:Tyrosine-protein phosphatase n=1 Tax=Cohnella fermenti TaxID=2565925 RepID=A0A4S4BJA7_9BACL|nr:tyrosine-protein phosphatase [Cohnella fermenti]THF74725.1 tyrosine-protein phosphatase [Cohnella fermenti]